MLIELATVVFNHDLNTAAGDALNIRVGRTQPASDWIHGASSPSLAAYTLAPAQRPLTIAARFSFPGPLPLPAGVTSVMVRAQPASTGVLGSVAETSVLVPPVAGATTIAIQLPLLNVAIWTNGIGRYDMSWHWQVQLTPGSAWIDFDRSDHTIYVTLDRPGEPWSQLTDAPHQPFWPWTTALDVACVWAQGVKLTGTLTSAADHVARAIESAINALGGRATLGATYQGSAEWVLETGAGSVFSFTAFLEFIGGNVPGGKDPKMNCTDCAAAVAACSNLLGCDLRIRRIKRKAALFHTNHVVRIGDGPSEPTAQPFVYHDVAMRQGTTDTHDHVHDACLKIDRDTTPFSSAHADYELSRGLTRGAFAKAKGRKYKYVHRLITSHDVHLCHVEVFDTPNLDVGAIAPAISGPVAQLWEQYNAQIAQLAKPSPVDLRIAVNLNPVAIANFAVYEQVASPEHLSRLEGLIDASVEFHYVAVSDRSKRRVLDHRLRLSVGFAKTSKRAREALAWLLTESAAGSRTVVHGSGGFVGDVAFIVPGNAAAFGVFGTAVVRTMSIGRNTIALGPILNTAISALRVLKSGPSVTSPRDAP